MKKMLHLSPLFFCATVLMACTQSKTPELNPNKNGVKEVPPNGAWQNSGSGLVVSEIVSRSDDEGFLGGSDWVEIYNSSSESIDMGAYSLADSSGVQFPLPSQTIEAGAYIVIAAVDADEPDPPQPYVPFKLGREDSVGLYLDSDLIHSLSWVDGESDKGRSFGFVDEVAQTTVPTAGLVNEAVAVDTPSGLSDLVINEVVVKSDDDAFLEGNDWIEIYNTGSEVLDLSSYFLADSSSGPKPLPPVFLGSGEFLVVAAVDVDNESPPSPSVPFKLGARDSVSLYEGLDLVGQLSWNEGDAGKGEGYGLVVGVAATTEPTPGAKNIALEEPLLVERSDLILSEVVVKSVDEAYVDGHDWIEIYNSGDSAIELSQYSLADSGGEKFVLSGVLAAGQYKVYAAIDADDASPGYPFVPFKLGREDFVGLYLDGELVRLLSWFDGEVAAGFSYGIYGGVGQTMSPSPGQANEL